MTKDYVIGVDLGGTKILTAIADLEGNILAKVRKDTEAKKGKDVVIQRIKDTVYEVIKEIDGDLSEVKGVGLGVPGPLNISEGIIKSTPNLDFDNLNIIEELSDLNLPIFLENDANAAAIGEKWFGAGKGADNMLYITVSTGIGGGIIINKDIYHGVGDGAGEIGHITLIPDSKVQCGCGNYGCWEALASGTALIRMGREAVESDCDTKIAQLVDSPEEIDGAIIAQAFKEGDEVAKELMNQLATYLGIGLASMINVFNPEKIVVGGGVSQSWDLLKDKVSETIDKRAMSSLVEGVEVVTADLGSEVGVIGALAVALTSLDLL
ncbi:ROK family protein [Halonatronum saccharophilum]|uniref:ROK family protein n=1 Tax=Halonatronum saccharophilum TaxID=150060 RepID=UPI0004832551|nr:ROK family protein [Halonatronum saccharophilum]